MDLLGQEKSCIQHDVAKIRKLVHRPVYISTYLHERIQIYDIMHVVLNLHVSVCILNKQIYISINIYINIIIPLQMEPNILMHNCIGISIGSSEYPKANSTEKHSDSRMHCHLRLFLSPHLQVEDLGKRNNISPTDRFSWK